MNNADAVEKMSEWQKAVYGEYRSGNHVHYDKPDGETTLVYTQLFDELGKPIPGTVQFHGLLPCVKSIVVGIDIREYSRRDAEQQLFLTVTLFARIRQVIGLLRFVGLCEIDQPPIVVSTGDGAHVVFTFPIPEIKMDEYNRKFEAYIHSKTDLHINQWVKRRAALRAKMAIEELAETRKDSDDASVFAVASSAFSFVLALNAVLVEDGERRLFHQSPESKDGFNAFPMECRYVMSYENVLLMKDVNNMLNACGSALITCARILSTDKGSHFLVDYELVKDLERHGGLNHLCKRQWNQDFHTALMDSVNVKSGTFRFQDVFGFYDDALLMQAMRQTQTKPKRFHIGSHNVMSILSGS
jgi:hypothetical protein